MPYVPSEQTSSPKGITKNGKAQDRILLDKVIKKVSKKVANRIETNEDILKEYFRVFLLTGQILTNPEEKRLHTLDFRNYHNLAEMIIEVGEAYDYQGAFLGELNYAITRLIQEVPKRLVEQGKQQSELRYYIYAYTIEALIRASNHFSRNIKMLGIGGVFEDIKDEYKRRVNTSYECAQIIKSGDCYDTPFFTKLVEIRDQYDKLIGYQEVMIRRKNNNSKNIIGVILTRT